MYRLRQEVSHDEQMSQVIQFQARSRSIQREKNDRNEKRERKYDNDNDEKHYSNVNDENNEYKIYIVINLNILTIMSVMLREIIY